MHLRRIENLFRACIEHNLNILLIEIAVSDLQGNIFGDICLDPYPTEIYERYSGLPGTDILKWLYIHCLYKTVERGDKFSILQLIACIFIFRTCHFIIRLGFFIAAA